MSRVDAILAVFTKTIAQLEKVARNNRTEAGFKMASADALELQAEGLLDEAQKADKVAARLKDLLEGDE
ncbi:hypothetical protein [Pseudomonas sp. EA_35y_Pfl2_R5]|uniref:hypothetical protein n=1 Tax=Pseudomonas sp. EA_35y_Pfl2_R5 TaxID=3088690 RepID=UPI0030D86F69